MEELKIWTVTADGSREASELETTRKTETEELLEDVLTKNPAMLENGLELVGRQTDTAGGPLDLLGVDSEGRLVVFELKRGTLNRDAVAQVIDYASALAAMDLDSLYRHIAERSGNQGIQKLDDFKEWYDKNYSDPDHDPDSLMPPRIVLVGLGVDETTARMVSYLASGGLDISLLTFHGFRQGGDTLLARNVRVDGSDTLASTTTPGPTRNDKKSFAEHVRTGGVQPLVEAVTTMFINQSGRRFTQTHAQTRRHFRLDFKWYPHSDWTKASILFIDLDKGGIKVGFQPSAIALVKSDEFDNLQTEGLEFERDDARTHFNIQGAGGDELKLPLRSLKDWEDRQEQLAALVQKVCKGYDALKEKTLEEKVAGGE